MMLICENCGGNCIEVGRFSHWVSFQCENCKMSWSTRPDSALHEETLKKAFGEFYDAKKKEYKKRVKELVANATI